MAIRRSNLSFLNDSFAASSSADTMGADGVELDVRWVPDGRLVIAHDPLPDAVAEVDAMGLASFDEALDACGDRMLVNVEIKNWPTDAGFDPTMGMVGPVIDALRRRGSAAASRWLISSFSWETLEACRAAVADIATGGRDLDRTRADRSDGGGRARGGPPVGAERDRGVRRSMSRRRAGGQHLDVQRPATSG